MIFSPRFIFVLFIFAVFTFLIFKIFHFHKKRLRMNKVKWSMLSSIFVLALLFIFGNKIYYDLPRYNQQCLYAHKTSLKPVKNPFTPVDFFNQGDYDFASGNCEQAIKDYTQAIRLDSNYAEAYNNRAYTYMMIINYKQALSDLNRAIEIRPDYVHALMNRGDIYNFYLIDRPKAIADYNKVISLGLTTDRTVCGHRFLAIHGGWTFKALLDFPMSWQTGCQ